MAGAMAMKRRLARLEQQLAPSVVAAARDDDGANDSARFHSIPLFRHESVRVTDEQRAQMDSDGHLVLPGLLTPDAVDRLIASLSRIHALREMERQSPGVAEMEAVHRRFNAKQERGELTGELNQRARQTALEAIREQHPRLRRHGVGATAMEHDVFLESCVGHPQMLELARSVLGEDIRFDHMVALNRPGGNPPMGYHSHEYADGLSTFGAL
jgi:hypothetical protein